MVFGLSGTGVRLAAEKVFAFSGMRTERLPPARRPAGTIPDTRFLFKTSAANSGQSLPISDNPRQSTLEEQGLKAEVNAAREVRSLDSVGPVVRGTPLYMGALHKDVRALLERHQAALERTPLALCAFGPVSAGEGARGHASRLTPRWPSCRASLPSPRRSSSASTPQHSSASKTR